MWETLIKLDGSILVWIQENIRSDTLTPVIKFITHLGDHGRLWILLALVLLVIKKTRATGGMMAVSLLCTYLLNNLWLKNLVARTRPYEVVQGLQSVIGAQGEYSFPSGHASSSFAAAVVIYLLCPRKAGIPAVILAALIALSRLYVGVHYPTDVLAGAVNGTLIAVLVCYIYRKKIQEASKWN
jgi:undecaprenyl-diphosphatase